MMTAGSKHLIVLGSDGMLGNMLVNRALSKNVQVTQINRMTSGFDASSTSFDWLDKLQPSDLLVNCIARTRIDNQDCSSWPTVLEINSMFPQRLARATSQLRIPFIQISTDGVYKGRTQPYFETDEPECDDIYGLSKALGESTSLNTLNIRSSIVGPEVISRGHLMNWLLTQPDHSSVNGFTNHIWHGVTTLQMADLCISLMEQNRFNELRKKTHILHFVPNAPISKYELLKAINQAFGRRISVKPMESRNPLSRRLDSRYEFPDGSSVNSTDIRDALDALAHFTTKKEAIN